MATSEKHFIVTGAAGFVGEALIRHLKEQGHYITALSHHAPPKEQGIDWIEGDVRQPETWEKMPQTADVFVHLAAQTSKDDPTSLFETNVIGTWMALRYCLERAIPRFVFTSTQAVYGKPDRVPVLEVDALTPQTLYGTTKAGAGLLVARYKDLFPSGSSAVLRLSTVYGPGMKKNVVRTFLDGALRGKPLAVVNGGLDAYDFVYITDVVKAILLASFSREQGVFNIGSGCASTILSVAAAVKRAAPQTQLIMHSNLRDPRHFVMDINRAVRLLGYRPEVNLEEGIRNTWEKESL